MIHCGAKKVAITLWCLALIAFGHVAEGGLGGRARISYYMTEEGGEWVRNYTHELDLLTRGRSGLENLLGFNVGVVRREGAVKFLGGLAPNYSFTLGGRHYRLWNNYTMRTAGDVKNSQLTENLNVELPGLPRFSLLYTQQGMKGAREEQEIDMRSTRQELRASDQVGPLRVSLSRQETTVRDLIVGADRNLRSRDTFADADVAYGFGQFLSLTGRYRGGWLWSERETIGVMQGRSDDVTANIGIHPSKTISLSSALAERRERRFGLQPAATSEYRSGQFQLTLYPLSGFLLDAVYLLSETRRNRDESIRNESRYVTLDIRPRQVVSFVINASSHRSRLGDRRLTALNRYAAEVRTEVFRGLYVTSRFDLSASSDFSTQIRNRRLNLIMRFEMDVTRHIRVDVALDQLRFRRVAGVQVDHETRQQTTVIINYMLPQVIGMNLQYVRSAVSSPFGGPSSNATYSLNVVTGSFVTQIRYSRVVIPDTFRTGVGPSLQTAFTANVTQRMGRWVDLFSKYELRPSPVDGARGATKRIEVGLNARF